MSQIRKAVLVKRQTDDGLAEAAAEVPLGKEYLVDIDAIQSLLAYNLDHQVYHRRLWITIVDDQGRDEGVWPMELLAIEPETVN